ncbi:MAG: hypothetical protein K2N27_07100 [Ruminococcus sp.]|nr:hypothetical protein [Ruminococcus sp.]
MRFDDMCTIARITSSQKTSLNIPLNYNDTICVVCTSSGKIITGVSQLKYMNNIPMSVHAEIDVYNNLISDSDNAVSEISLFNAVNFQPVIPCNECISKIISLNPNSSNAMLILPDRSIPVLQINAFLQSQNSIANQFKGASSVNNSDSYQYLQNRLNEFLVDDDEEDEENEKSKEKGRKKGLFNFFKGKSDK